MATPPSFWTDTITVFFKRVNADTEETTYAPSVLLGCFWENKFEEVRMQDGSVRILTSVVRIPAGATGGVRLSTDDILALGDVTAYAPSGGTLTPADMQHITNRLKREGKGAGRVYSVSDNTGRGIGVPHWNVRCQQ